MSLPPASPLPASPMPASPVPASPVPAAPDHRGWAARLRASAVLGSRGDVPGWVLVTVMTAGLVTTLWVLADGTFSDVFSRAVQSVSRS